MRGWRWAFGLVAAIAASTEEARSTTCMTGPFFVFFDRDEDEITARAQPILDHAASVYGNCGIRGRITIDGHADRSGSEAHNMSLSRRRADRVRAYLIERGLPVKEIVVQAFGESRPLIGTPDGAPEAQNRRVEFTYSPEGW